MEQTSISPATEAVGSMASPSSRPKRRTAAVVNYKEKAENDIGSRVVVVQPPRKYQRSSNGTPSKKSSANSTSTSEKSASSTPTTTSSSSSSSSSTSTKKSESTRSSKKDDSTQFIPIDEECPWNWQPPFRPNVDKFNNILNPQSAKLDNTNTILSFKDGTVIRKNDFIYMICEPPTEPYYIAQVVGFVKKEKVVGSKKIRSFYFNVCWFYRPRDLSRKDNDSRLLYASLHSDECPIQSFRGFATVKHKSEIEDIEKYRSKPNCFYFDRLYDRYMIKLYEVLATSKLINLPPNYYKALNKRYEYVFVENGRSMDLLSAPKNCDKCYQWCSTADSIQCHKCEKYYHLLCLDPPILTKPKRGFGWYCAACNRDIEKQLSDKRGKMLESNQLSLLKNREKEEESEEQEAETTPNSQVESNTNGNGNEGVSEVSSSQNEDSASKESTPSYHLPKYEELAIKFLEADSKVSFDQRRQMEEWPYRYLGMHAKLEDALDLQGRPYARAASRLGSKHQFTGMVDWYNHPVVYYEDENGGQKGKQRGRKSNVSNFRKNAIANSSTPAPDELDAENMKLELPEEFKDVNPKEYPPWLQRKPRGYIERGSDLTATLLWKNPEKFDEKELDAYYSQCTPFAKNLGLLPTSPNFMDAILKTLMDCNYNTEEALLKVAEFTRSSLKEPTLSPEEVHRFEESVKRNGSELYPVYKDVETQSPAMIVRFYYLWKKTKQGHAIWDNFEGRPKNRLKSAAATASSLKEEANINDSGDDSAYSEVKRLTQVVDFECKHCHTHKSIQWFKAPGGGALSPQSEDEPVSHSKLGLCIRCARLWRRYAVEWEIPNEVIKKQMQKSSTVWKRKVESELVDDAYRIINARDKYKLKPKKMSAAAIAAKAKAQAMDADSSMIEEDDTATESSPSSRSSSPAPSKATKKRTKASENGTTTTTTKTTTNKRAKSNNSMESAVNVDDSEEEPKKKILKTLKIKRSQKKDEKEQMDSLTVVIPYQAEKRRSTDEIKPEKKPKIRKSKKKAIEDEVEFEEDSQELEPDNFATERRKAAQSFARRYFEQALRTSADSRGYHIEAIHKIADRFVKDYEISTGPSHQFLQNAETLNNQQYEDFMADWILHHAKASFENSLKSKFTQLPIFNVSKRACCVCRQEGDISEVVVCTNCGLNVHASCYGVELAADELKPYEKKWFCDPCSNDLHPIAHTNYSCSLCSSRESDHDSGLKGDPHAFPDALKRTIDGHWVHVICSLFADECKYANSKILQPVTGVSVEVFKNMGKLCVVCGVMGGGLRKCRFCDNKFHLTCCQDTPNVTYGFELVIDSTDKDKGSVKVKGKGEGRLVPVVCCNYHLKEPENSNFKIFPIRTLGKKKSGREEQTLMQYYIKDYKKNNLSGGPLKRDIYEQLVELSNESTEENDSVFKEINGNINEEMNKVPKCVHCNTEKSLMWYNDDTTCHKCYVRLQINESVEDIKLPNIRELTDAPLNGSKFGINSPDDTIENYKINFKTNGYQPSKVSINNLLS